MMKSIKTSLYICVGILFLVGIILAIFNLNKYVMFEGIGADWKVKITYSNYIEKLEIQLEYKGSDKILKNVSYEYEGASNGDYSFGRKEFSSSFKIRSTLHALKPNLPPDSSFTVKIKWNNKQEEIDLIRINK